MLDSPKRVLQIVTYMPRGGLETMLMNYYRNIDRGKIQFDFLEHRNEYTGYDKEIESLGGKIYKLPKLNPLSKKYTKAMIDFFREHTEYKIVHSHINSMSGLSLSFAEKAGVPIRIAHSHNTSEEKNIKFPLKNYYRQKLRSVATDRIACGQQAGKWLFGEKDFLVLNNAIDTERFLFSKTQRQTVREALGIKADDFVLGHVGRFFKQKNHVFLIDIFNEVYRMNKKSKLILAGVGPLQKAIQEKVTGYGLTDHVIFYGLSDRVWEILSALDAFVLPSLHEGLPVTLIEAQTSGLKCYISDTVTKESILTDNVTVLALKSSAKTWAQEICSTAMGYVREDKKEDIIRVGYDVSTNVRWLEKYYFERWDRINN